MSNIKKFQKKVENFKCENCSKKVIGDGFTNHCTSCFYSRHVDIFPGDRLESCGGLMKPIDIEVTKGTRYIITHQCKKCAEVSKDKFREGTDNFDDFLKVVEKINKKKEKKV